MSLALLALLCACKPNAPYRTTAGVCGAADCTTGSIERHTLNVEPPAEYLLGVVEFDDQGNKHLPAQMDALFDRLKAESADQDLCIVVFVHGWKHNASFDDSNMQEFRLLLENIARTEHERAHAAWDRPRKVFGIYAGWRGKLVDADLISDLTFWNRKDAAQRVALGSIRELLGRARAFRDTTDRFTWSGRLLPAGSQPAAGEKMRSTRLLTIGHSFGGLIVYTALAQYFTDRAAAAAMAPALGATSDDDKRIASYGDLVVIVNPAVEAVSWEPIRQIVENRHAQDFARDQRPVFVQVTSTADEATGMAFPAGRLADVINQSFDSESERKEALHAVGHYEPFWTHDLTSNAATTTQQQQANRHAGIARAAPAVAMARTDIALQQECNDNAAFEARFRRDGYLLPGWVRTYTGGAVLSHRANSRFDANDPFWMVKADKSVIAGHSDISEPVFVTFVTELYDDMLLGAAGCKPPAP
jgi:hypothetical protein